MDAITELAEELAQSLRRSVAVDDVDLRLLASSTHFGDADPLRLASLANRRIEGPVREATFAAGFPHWREPRRGHALGIDGHEHDRMAFPLRSRHEALGVMWVIVVGDDDLSPDEMARCLATAHEMERVLIRRRHEESETAQEVETLLFTLLSAEATDRANAERDLLDMGLFADSAVVTAIVVEGGHAPPPHGTDEWPTALRRALHRAVSTHGRSVACAADEHRGFLLLGSRGEAVRAEIERIAARAADEVGRIDPRTTGGACVGVGSAVPLDATARSYDRAVVATRIARRTGRTVALWEEHPTEALLDAALRPAVAAGAVPPLLADTVDGRSAETLQTVGRFLEEAGNVARTAERLHLHRTTVYYRLRNFEKETGLSLDDGGDRFLLQLWLRIRDRVTATDG